MAAAGDLPPWLSHELLGKMFGRAVKGVVGEPLAPGNGFASAVLRVTVTLDQGDVRQIIVKRPPSPHLNDFYPIRETFEIEARVYHEILPSISRLLRRAGGRDQPPLGPRMLLRMPEPEPALYFEDITVQGFRLPVRLYGQDAAHARLVLRSLARWHAAGSVLLQQQPEMFNNMPMMVIEEHDKLLNNFLCQGLERFVDYAGQWGDELSKRVVSKLRKLTVNSRQRILDAHRPEPLGQGFNVSLHGDTWPGNMLFRYDSDGKPEEVRLIDYQISSWGSPASDLLYFSCTLSGEARAELGQLVAEYHAELADTLRALDATHVPTLSEIQEDLRRRSFIEVIQGCAGMALVMAPTSIGLTMSAILGGFSGEGPDPVGVALGMEPFQKNMKQFFASWEREGLLDALLAQ